ncbi:MAG: hypothetical protein IPO07_28620 [Haliscomenobacter sp.]|nr:hypothetical protein [Haliscomenobacter sp.]MBK9492313.1 hypothetical protein [Haliscomenobacter sp.]
MMNRTRITLGNKGCANVNSPPINPKEAISTTKAMATTANYPPNAGVAHLPNNPA